MEASIPCSANLPSSTAATAGKYEFEMRSGTAIFMATYMSGGGEFPANALQQRGSHQECAVRSRVGGVPAQRFEISFSLRGVFLFQPLLVGDGLLLDIFDIHRPPHGVVARKVAIRTPVHNH